MKLFGQKKSLAERRTAASQRLAELELAEPALAHAAANDDPVAAQKWRQCRASIVAEQDEIAMLEKAIAHEKEQAERKRNARVMAERERIKERAEAVAQDRIGAAEEFFQKLEAAMASYHRMQDLTRDLIACVPLYQPADPGLGLYASEIRDHVAREIFRLDGLPTMIDGYAATAFPQPKLSPFYEHANQPHMITPLVEQLRIDLHAMRQQMNVRPVWPAAPVTGDAREISRGDLGIVGAQQHAGA